MNNSETTPVWLRRYTMVVAAATLFLVFAGAMVTSTGSGLAVPDWPLSYGMVFPPMVGGIFYEHGHRMIAATVGFLTIIQAVWLQIREPKRFVRRLGWASLGVVILQGLLGGLTVLFLLPTAVSVSHAGLAEIFLCLNVSIAFFTSRFHHDLTSRPASRATGVASWSKVLVIVVYAQIIVGAVMRHLSAGLAIPDFPLSFGRVIPELTSSAITVNFAHRLGAVVVTLVLVAMAPRVIRSGIDAVRRIYIALIALLSIQITLAAYTVWTSKQPIVTSFHVVTGAAILGCSVVFALTCHLAERSARREEIGQRVGEVAA